MIDAPPLPVLPTTGRRRFLLTATAATLGAPYGALRAQDAYPSRQIQVVVAYVPGGQGDFFARLIGDRLTRVLGQSAIVDNRPGGSGAIGTRFVAKSRPDGYTLLLGQTGEMAVNVSAMKDPGYDTLRDLRGVALVGNSPLVMAAPRDAPYSTIEELLKLARSNPEAVSYGSSGTATPGHLAAATLALATKTKMPHVPYKGGGQAITDLMGGYVQFFFSSAAAILPHIKGGRIKALAVTSAKRMPALPNVPTVAEAAVPGFEFGLWGGYFAPRATSDTVVTKLNAAVNGILREPEVRTRFDSESLAVEPITAAQFDDFVKTETVKYARIIRDTGVRID